MINQIEDTIHECGVCYDRFDTGEHIPMILPQCRHTICKVCLDHILSQPKATCPFDRKRFYFHKDGQYLASQINLYVLNSLQSISSDYQECPVHREPLKYYCIASERKICRDCYASSECKNHQVVRIGDLRERQLEEIETMVSPLGKRMFEERESAENFDEDEEEILKKQKLEISQDMIGNKIAKYEEAIKQMREQLFILDKKEKALQRMKEILSEELNALETQFTKYEEEIQEIREQLSKLAEEKSTIQKSIELMSEELCKYLAQKTSPQAYITWEDLDHDIEGQHAELGESQTLLDLKLGSFVYKIKSNFAITINNEELNGTINDLSGEECVVDTGQLMQIKFINIDIQSLVFNEEYLVSLRYIFHRLPQVKSLSVSCQDFQFNDSIQPLEKRLQILFEEFFSQTQELKNIRIHWKAAYGADEILNSVVKGLRMKKLELESLDLCFENDKNAVSYSIFQNLIQNLQQSKSNLETLKLAINVRDCTIEELNGLELQKLRNLVWNVECRTQQCKETFSEMTRKFFLDSFGTMRSLENLEFSLIITENLKEENFIKIFELLKEFELLNELKITMSDEDKRSLLKTKGLIRLVGDAAPHLSQMLNLKRLSMGVRLGSFYKMETSSEIIKFLDSCLEQSMRY